ncbi:hypothetical protein PRZ48_003078 [Zasmidium cellare]|uniref:Uncharacterized protein n=1 Tax=Zasmidium cellare TaxID=395010 RepID=A0ABR0EUI2_ZASCE|nr:hypothetical protein PRZ48_003078 [Zasmidium cellare]
MSAQNHGEKAGEGVKGIFKSINDVGESLRGNINGALDGFGDAITGNNRSHAHTNTSTGSTGLGHNTGSTGLGHNTGSTGLGHNNGSTGLGHSTGSSGLGHSMGGNSGFGHSTGSTTTTGVQNGSEKVRRDLNQGLDDAGRKVEGFFHHHK